MHAPTPRVGRLEVERRGAAVTAVRRARRLAPALVGALLLAGCQIASSPPEVSITTTRTRGATATPAAASVRPTSAAPTITASAPTATPRPATATLAPTAARVPATAGPTLPAPTVAPTARPAVATPAPGQRAAATTPTVNAAAIPTFPRATLLPTPSRPAAASGPPAGGDQLSGEVLSFAASARVLQVRTGGATQEVSLAPGATVHRADGSPASAADLRAGQQVRVAVARNPDGSIVASDLTIVRGP